MLPFVLAIPSPILANLFVAASVLFAIVSVNVAHRLVSQDILKSHNDVTSSIFAMLGVVYAVLLAFVVIIGWEQYQNVAQAVDKEDNEVLTIFKLAQAFPSPTSAQLQTGLRIYTQNVVDDEWGRLGRNDPTLASADPGVTSFAALEQLWNIVTAFEPQTARESDLHSKLLDGLRNSSLGRRERTQADHARIPGILWFLLISGGAVTIIFASFFGASDFRLHALTAAALAATIAFTLFLVFARDHPFAGSVRVQPDSFRNVLTFMQRAARK